MKRIRLSESAQELLHLCERKFQLERLLIGEQQRIRINNEFFSRGHAFGKGVQVYMITQNMDLALYQAWLAYYPEIESPTEGVGKNKVTQIRTLHLLLCAQQAMDLLLEQYEVVSFKGKPAAELGIKIDIDETYYFVGFIDLVLRNRATGRYVVLDMKATGSWKEQIEVLYKNSGQLIGYSIGLDAIVGEELAEYDVMYFVCQDSNPLPKDIKYHILPFKKTLKDRLKWFLSLGIDVERIKLMRELNIFPQRGSACNSFNKTCPHFGLCGMTEADEEAEDVEDPYEKKGLYSFVYNMQDLIEDHMRRSE